MYLKTKAKSICFFHTKGYNVDIIFKKVRNTMKVLAINTSPRKGRNTEQLLNEVIKGCRSIGEHVEVEM